MSYRYQFDRTLLTVLEVSRSNFQIVQEGLRLLHHEIEEWNRRVIETGGSYPPYQQEAHDLKKMIDVGNRQLAENNDSEILIGRISVGNLRYWKAAITLWVNQFQQEYEKKVRDNWPERALSSLAARIENAKNFTRTIDHEPSDILREIQRNELVRQEAPETPSVEWDVFVSHASEDKEAFVRPLAERLQTRGLHVWFDEFTLTIGDSLRRSIDRGLVHSKFGVVVISPHFLQKNWPLIELDGLVAREVDGKKVILPVWHEIDRDRVAAYSPTLADRLAVSSERGLEHVVAEIMRATGRQ